MPAPDWPSCAPDEAAEVLTLTPRATKGPPARAARAVAARAVRICGYEGGLGDWEWGTSVQWRVHILAVAQHLHRTKLADPTGNGRRGDSLVGRPGVGASDGRRSKLGWDESSSQGSAACPASRAKTAGSRANPRDSRNIFQACTHSRGWDDLRPAGLSTEVPGRKGPGIASLDAATSQAPRAAPSFPAEVDSKNRDRSLCVIPSFHPQD